VQESKESGLWHFARNCVLSFAAVLALGFLLLVSLLVTAGLAAAGIFVSPYMPEGDSAPRQPSSVVCCRGGLIRDDV
jgi:hypothetical protein